MENVSPHTFQYFYYYNTLNKLALLHLLHNVSYSLRYGFTVSTNASKI